LHLRATVHTKSSEWSKTLFHSVRDSPPPTVFLALLPPHRTWCGTLGRGVADRESACDPARVRTGRRSRAGPRGRVARIGAALWCGAEWRSAPTGCWGDILRRRHSRNPTPASFNHSDISPL